MCVCVRVTARLRADDVEICISGGVCELEASAVSEEQTD